MKVLYLTLVFFQPDPNISIGDSRLYRHNLQAILSLTLSMFGRDISQENINTMKHDAMRFKQLSTLLFRTAVVFKERSTFSAEGIIIFHSQLSTPPQALVFSCCRPEYRH
jgi:hypothetical protein